MGNAVEVVSGPGLVRQPIRLGTPKAPTRRFGSASEAGLERGLCRIRSPEAEVTSVLAAAPDWSALPRSGLSRRTSGMRGFFEPRAKGGYGSGHRCEMSTQPDERRVRTPRARVQVLDPRSPKGKLWRPPQTLNMMLSIVVS